MPSGVEHMYRRRGGDLGRYVIAASMPSGVEHFTTRWCVYTPGIMIAASMPSGVEHGAIMQIMRTDFGS